MGVIHGLPVQEYHHLRYIKTVAALQHRLGGECAVCQSVEDLEFDHVDPQTKAFSITAHWNWPIEKLRPELAKCQLLCHACHRQKSESQGTLGGGHYRVESPDHGTQVMYAREGCRCDECRGWRRQYRQGIVDARGRLRSPGT